MKRYRMSKKSSRRSFGRGARNIHKKNFAYSGPMRGGIRL